MPTCASPSSGRSSANARPQRRRRPASFISQSCVICRFCPVIPLLRLMLKMLVLLVLALVAGRGLYLLNNGVRNLLRAGSSVGWPKVEGLVVRTEETRRELV